MGAGVSLSTAQQLLQDKCAPAHLHDQLTTATVTGCHSLHALNTWFRVHCSERKYVAKIINKESEQLYFKPLIPDPLNNSQERRCVSLSAYLDELLALASQHPSVQLKHEEDDNEARLISPSAVNSKLQIPNPSVATISQGNGRLTPSPTLTSQPIKTSATEIQPLLSLDLLAASSSHTDDQIANDVELISGPSATSLFVSALLNVLYTQRQRRASASLTNIDTTGLSAFIHHHTHNTTLVSSSQTHTYTRQTLSSRRHLRAIHSNLPAIEEVCEYDGDGQSVLVVWLKHFPRSLAAFLRIQAQTNALDSTQLKLFLVFQLLHCLSFLHQRRVVHGNVKTENCMLTGNMWIYVTGLSCPGSIPASLSSSPSSSASSESQQQQQLQESCLMRWVRGEMGNFDYLMELNRLAGREIGGVDVADHPILPWVTDFSSATSAAYRDLSKSKFRLKKGDDQLDFTYLHSPTNPHHIPELFSDITYFVYLARITPLPILRKIVRDRFVAAEYPPSMARIYQWTPDEAIPEFYTDSSVFVSQHKELGLEDLQIPAWTADIQAFVQWHRSVLESAEVSAGLPDWIDITFGYKLSGPAAVEAKNVPLKQTKQSSRRSAFIQLFTQPHPHKLNTTLPQTITATSQQHQAEMEQAGEAGVTSGGDDEPVTIGVIASEQNEMTVLVTDVNGQEQASISIKESPRPTETAIDASAAAVSNPEPMSLSASPSSSSLSASASAARTHIDSSAIDLSILQAAAVFDTEFIGLQGCYAPILQIHKNRLDGINMDLDGDDDDEDREDERAVDANNQSSDSDWEVIESDDQTEGKLTTEVAQPTSTGAEHNHTDKPASNASSTAASSPVASPLLKPQPAVNEASVSIAPLSPSTTLAMLQAGDIFSVGCIAAELFLGQPLFSTVTHRLYAAGVWTPSLSSIPVAVRKFISSMIHRDWEKRPSAAELLNHSVFRRAQHDADVVRHACNDARYTNVYQTVYDFVAELRRQQSLFHHPTAGATAPTATPSAGGSAAASTTATAAPSTPESATLSAPVPASSPYLLPTSSSFNIPSDDISTPPVQPSPLTDIAIITPPEPSPLIEANRETDTDTLKLFAKRKEEGLDSDDEHDHEDDNEDDDSDEEDGGSGEEDSSLDKDLGDELSVERTTTTRTHVVHDHPVDNSMDSFLNTSTVDPISKAQMTLDWVLDQLTHLTHQLPLPAFLLLIPHVLTLPTHASLYIASLSLFAALAPKLGRSLSSKLLLPALQQLCARVENIDLQCELLSITTLRLVYTRFSYGDGFREYLSYVRNSMLSLEWRVSEAAVTTVVLFVVETLNMRDDREQEIAVRELLLPMFSRLGRTGSETILNQLINIAGDVEERLIVHFFLPMTIQLIEKGSAAVTTTNAAELDLRLCCGLDLLYALLPEVSFATLQYLVTDSTLLKPLLVGTARGPLSATAMRKLLRVLLYIVVELGMNGEEKTTPTSSGTSLLSGITDKSKAASDSAVRFQNPRLILPLLPLFAEFLNQIMNKMEQQQGTTTSPHAEQVGDYDARTCYEFIHLLYLGLCTVIGAAIVRKAVSSTVKIENLLSQPAPPSSSSSSSSSSSVGLPSPGMKTSHHSIISISSPSRHHRHHHRQAHVRQLDFTHSADVDRVKKHGIISKQKRAHWEEREQERERQRQERKRLEKMENDALTMAALDGHALQAALSYAEDESAAGGGEEETAESGEVSTTSQEKDKGRGKSGSKDARVIHHASTNSANLLPSPSPSAGSSLSSSTSSGALDQKKSIFSWLSSAASSSDSSALSMDMSELWLIDPPLSANAAAAAASSSSNSWKYKATVKHTLKAHSSAVLCMDTHPHFGVFVSGGKDEVVKVWSVGIGSGGLHCQAVYKGHRAPINEVKLLMDDGCNVTRSVASCDGGLQVWDIETGQIMMQSPFGAALKEPVSRRSAHHPVNKDGSVNISSHLIGNSPVPTKGEQPQPITSFTFDHLHQQLLLGTSIGTMRHLDVRSGYLSGPWRHLGSAQPVAAVKCICINHRTNLVITGLATGELTVFDQRTGLIRFQWRGHEGAVVSVCHADSDLIVSTGADKCICIWDISTTEPVLVHKYSGMEEQVRSVAVYQNDFIVVFGAGKIGFGSLTQPGSTLSTKKPPAKLNMTTLKNYTSRSNISSIIMLPTYKSAAHTNLLLSCTGTLSFHTNA